MPNYFSYFPKIYYDAVGAGNYKQVTHLLSRVQIKQGLKETGAFFDEYIVQAGETPEILAEKFYGSINYYWVILIFNNIKDRYYDWPLSQYDLEQYISDKYTNPNGVHHYEKVQDSGPQSSIDNSHIIEVSSDVAGATPVTNYEYEQREQLKKSRIRMLRPEFIDAFIEEFKGLLAV
jgi:hypothetical protein